MAFLFTWGYSFKFGIGLFSGYKLNSNLIFILKIILYLTGLILFLTTIKPFKKITFYYSFYPFSGIFTVLFFLFGGIFLAILSAIVLIPIFPKQTEYKSDIIKIYSRFQGFIARCCSYEVVEPRLLIFEKHLGYININKHIDAENDEFSYKNNAIIYKYKPANYKQPSVSDTTVILRFE